MTETKKLITELSAAYNAATTAENREAIAEGMQKIKALERALENLDLDTGDPYVIVRGGLVSNEPMLPVIDLDMIDGTTADPGIEDEVNAKIETAQRVGCHEALAELKDFLKDLHFTHRDHFEDLYGRDEMLELYGDEWEPEAVAVPEVQDYVVLEGGLVTNDPSLPVIDMDLLEIEAVSAHDLGEAQEQARLARSLGRADLAERFEAFYQDKMHLLKESTDSEQG